MIRSSGRSLSLYDLSAGGATDVMLPYVHLFPVIGDHRIRNSIASIEADYGSWIAAFLDPVQHMGVSW